jgi:hypothetical protein
MITVMIYLVAIVAANLSVLYFGPASMPVNAFLFIGLDLTLRDKLHEAWRDNLAIKMSGLIAFGSAITYLLNASASRIALASMIAFGAAALFDTLVYQKLIRKPFLVRANGSNVAGALVDSVLFPTVAFGVFMPWVIAGQWVAKVFGGALWAWLLVRFRLVATACVLGLLPLSVAAQPKPFLLASAHYDLQKEIPIIEVVYEIPALPFFINGFFEIEYDHTGGILHDEWAVMSRHWVSYSLTRRLSLSVETEVSYNHARGWRRWPTEEFFDPTDPKLYVQPKIGFQYRLI